MNEGTRLFLICCVIGALILYFAFEAWLAAHPRCPDCSTRISRSAHLCPHCGYRFKPAPSPEEISR